MARDRRELRRLFWAGGGGGALTAGTVVFKFLIGVLYVPLLLKTVLLGLNYAVSFLLMQVFGFRLATKQPPLFGALWGRASLSGVAHSQMAATLGNFVLVVVFATLIHALCQRLGFGELLSEAEARHTFASLSPIGSGTALFAALTGMLLWLSGAVFGWIRQVALQWRIGRAISQASSRAYPPLLKHLPGVGFSLVLAVLLTVVPLVGKVAGIPLEVRHFTLSSGALMLSLWRLGWGASMHAGLLQAAAGIAVIALLNFGVSFLVSAACAFFVRRSRREGWTLINELRLAEAQP